MASNSGGGGHGGSIQSWIAASVIVIGFIVGGIAIIYWNWLLFWIGGVGVVVLGSVYGAATGIMNDVTEYGGGGAGGDPETSGTLSSSR